MKRKIDEITIRFSAAEYLTYIASIDDQQDSIEMLAVGFKVNNERVVQFRKRAKR